MGIIVRTIFFQKKDGITARELSVALDKEQWGLHRRKLVFNLSKFNK